MECWICRLIDGHLKLLEAEDARWLNREIIDSVDWLPADRAVVEKLRETDFL